MRRLFQQASLAVAANVIFAVGGALAVDDFHICVYESGDIAIDACTRVITSSGSPRTSKVVESYRNRGVEWYLKKDYDKAIADATSAIALAKDHSPSYFLRHSAYKAKGDEIRAQEDLAQAIRTDFNPEAYYERAGYKEQHGDVKGAIADYKAALETRKQKFAYIGQQKYRDLATEALKRLSKR